MSSGRRLWTRPVAIIAMTLFLMSSIATEAGAWYVWNDSDWQVFEAWVQPTYLSGSAPTLDVYKHGHVYTPGLICKDGYGANR